MICQGGREAVKQKGVRCPKSEKIRQQVNAGIPSTVCTLARDEGRQIQALVDEALADLIEKRKKSRPRSHVMAAYLTSHEKYSELHKNLAK